MAIVKKVFVASVSALFLCFVAALIAGTITYISTKEFSYHYGAWSCPFATDCSPYKLVHAGTSDNEPEKIIDAFPDERQELQLKMDWGITRVEVGLRNDAPSSIKLDLGCTIKDGGNWGEAEHPGPRRNKYMCPIDDDKTPLKRANSAKGDGRQFVKAVWMHLYGDGAEPYQIKYRCGGDFNLTSEPWHNNGTPCRAIDGSPIRALHVQVEKKSWLWFVFSILPDIIKNNVPSV